MDTKLFAYIAMGAGLIAGAAAAFIVYTTDDERSFFHVYSTQADINGGERIPSSALTRHQIPTTFDGLKEFAVFDNEDENSGLNWMLTQINRCDLPKGSLVPQRCLEGLPSAGIDDLIPPNMRAVTIDVDQSTSVGQFVRPGSRVDVLGTTLDSSEKMLTQVVLEDVRVVAVDQATTDFAYQQILERGYRTATLIVSPEQALKLFNESQLVVSSMALALRSAGVVKSE